MRHVLVLIGIAMSLTRAVAAQESLTDQFKARESAILDAVKAKRYDKMTESLDPSFTSVYNDGVHDRAGDIADTKSVTLRRFQLSDFKARQIDPSTVLVTYKVTVDASQGSKDASGSYWASSLWRHEAGHWLTILHTEAKAT